MKIIELNKRYYLVLTTFQGMLIVKDIETGDLYETPDGLAVFTSVNPWDYSYHQLPERIKKSMWDNYLTQGQKDYMRLHGADTEIFD